MSLYDVLAPVLPVELDADGSLTVPHGGTFASLRTVTIAEGLEMVSLTQMLAWDLPLTAALRAAVAEQAHTTMLGTVTLAQRGEVADVVLRYNFPAGGLSDAALQTLVMLVLIAGAGVRETVTG